MSEPQRIDWDDEQDSGDELVLPSWIDAAIAKSGREESGAAFHVVESPKPAPAPETEEEDFETLIEVPAIEELTEDPDFEVFTDDRAIEEYPDAPDEAPDPNQSLDAVESIEILEPSEFADPVEYAEPDETPAPESDIESLTEEAVEPFTDDEAEMFPNFLDQRSSLEIAAQPDAPVAPSHHAEYGAIGSEVEGLLSGEQLGLEGQPASASDALHGEGIATPEESATATPELPRGRRLDEGWAPWLLAAVFFAGAAIVLAILIWFRPAR
jgi:hypothetical protein